MKRMWSIVGWAMLVLVAVVAAAVAVAWLAFPLDATTITIDGESFSLAGLSAGQLAALWAVAVLVTVGALLVGAAATVVGLAIGAFGIAIGVLAAVAALALAASPLLLVGWLVWRATRRQPRAVAPAATA